MPQYVDAYTDEMRATLLLPAGITSNASIKFKDEQTILNQAMEEGCSDIDQAYVTRVLPAKMRYNLEYLQNFGQMCIRDRSTTARTPAPTSPCGW